MSEPVVVVTDYVEPDLNWEAEQLEQLGASLRAHQLRNASADELARAAGDADVVVVNMAVLDETVIKALSSCRLIIRHGVGYDNVDVAAATSAGIAVTRIPDYCVTEVAEQALMLIMACRRRLPDQSRSLRRSRSADAWDFSGVEPIHRLHGATLGVVGCGQIGSVLLSMAEGLGVTRLAVDPTLGERGPIAGVRTVDVDTLLQESDVISVHVPLTAATRSMFGQPQFAAMKSTASLVNTSRGGIVDLDALDRALEDGLIASAGIDVYDVEPPGAGVRLLDNPRAICTPHLGWMSEESSWRIRELVVDEVRRFVSGLPARSPVGIS